MTFQRKRAMKVFKKENTNFNWISKLPSQDIIDASVIKSSENKEELMVIEKFHAFFDDMPQLFRYLDENAYYVKKDLVKKECALQRISKYT